MSADSFKRRLTAIVIPESSCSLETDRRFASLTPKGLMLLIILALTSSCASSKAIFFNYNMMGLSSENIFTQAKEVYRPNDIDFKAKFDPSADSSVFYYITVYRGVISKDFDLKTVWSDPQGQKTEKIETRHLAKHLERDPRYTSNIFLHSLPISSLEEKTGKWTVELYFDGEFIEKRSFIMLPKPEHALKDSAFQEIRIGGARAYVDIPIVKIGGWNAIPVVVPAGSIVAVSVKGELRNRHEPEKRRIPPWRLISFKIGDGPYFKLRGGPDRTNPHNMNVIQNATPGPLNFYLNPYAPTQWEGELSASVLIWEQEHQEHMEDDIEEFIKSRPGDAQLKNLSIRMAVFLRNDDSSYSRADKILEKLRGKTDCWSDADNANIWLVSADNENRMGRSESAKEYAEKAIEFAERSKKSCLKGTGLALIGRSLANQGCYEEALPFFNEALEITRTCDFSVCGETHIAVGLLFLELEKPADALPHFEKALQYLKRSDSRFSKPYAYFGLGHAQSLLDRDEEAKKSFGEALMEGERTSNANSIWRAHSGLGWIAEKQGELLSSFEHYAKSISIIEDMRTKISDLDIRSTFAESNLFVYERMIKLLQKMKRDREALHYLERAKARIMLDMLQNKAFSPSNKEENALLVEERSLKRQMDLLSRQRGQGMGDEEPQELNSPLDESTRESDSDEADLARLQADRRSVLEKIERLNPELASLITVNPLKAEQIQEFLDPETALLEYFLGTEDGWLFVVTNERVTSVPLSADSELLFRKISDLRGKVVDEIDLRRLTTKDYQDLLSELYQVLLQPIELENLGKKNLVIVPHGVLHYLPFHALISGDGKYLIESFTVSYLPSASILKYARKKNRGNSANLFAAANPDTDLPPLPGAELEAREISTFYPKRLVLKGKEATEASVKVQSPNYDLVLFSTHGEMIESDPMRSNLRFTSSESEDGRLTVSEIFDMQIKANLVTLSACETALAKGPAGDYPKGDDLVGLSRAFIHAGAPSVLASLWIVSDNSTVALMRSFFQHLKTVPKAEALRLAQLDLMKSRVSFNLPRGTGGITRSTDYHPGAKIDCSHPFFWAPFIMVGDWK